MLKKMSHVLRRVSLLLFMVLIVLVGVTSIDFKLSAILAEGSSQEVYTLEWGAKNNEIGNLDGTFISTGKNVWIGTHENIDQSYLFIKTSGNKLPDKANIQSAELVLTSSTEQEGNIQFVIKAEKTGREITRSMVKSIDSLQATSNSKSFDQNNKWESKKAYEYDVTNIIKEIQDNNNSFGSVLFIIKGTGKKNEIKTITALGTKKPRLVLKYTTDHPPNPSTPTPTPNPTPMPHPEPTPSPDPHNKDIWGVVAPEVLGTCLAEIHDRYVTKGEDGQLYRTWHPQTVSIDQNDNSGTKCVFAHEHGDNPASVKNTEISSQPVVFGYIGRRMSTSSEPHGHEEPHEGFKVYVANKGQVNDEGRTNTNDTRLVFHMGTGGAKRFDTQFHSMDFKIITSDGRKIFVQGMADTGGVDNICASPRQGKTVSTLDPNCKLGSLYEIWENKLRIINSSGDVVVQAIASTAVFDPITVMDPNNHQRLVYTSSSEFNESLLFPNNDRSGLRSCDRESYHGPVYLYNGRGKEVYYTDAMGMETSGGDLKQVVAKSNSGANFIATNDGQSQFKIRSNHCASGLGLKN